MTVNSPTNPCIFKQSCEEVREELRMTKEERKVIRAVKRSHELATSLTGQQFQRHERSCWLEIWEAYAALERKQSRALKEANSSERRLRRVCRDMQEDNMTLCPATHKHCKRRS